jgi:hypothetical protein
MSLGIDSLGVATIGSELEAATGKKIHPDAVFELETIRELAEYLDATATQPVARTSRRTSRRNRSSSSFAAANSCASMQISTP